MECVDCVMIRHIECVDPFFDLSINFALYVWCVPFIGEPGSTLAGFQQGRRVRHPIDSEKGFVRRRQNLEVLVLRLFTCMI